MLQLCLLCLCAAEQTPAAALQPDAFVLEAAQPNGQVVIGSGHPGLDGNRHGFEGGCAFRHGDRYHLFTAEMYDDPFWVSMRFGHWKSDDLKRWERAGTLLQSKGKGFEHHPRYSTWSPMPVYNQAENRWNLFYVCYEGPQNPGESTHMWGKIYRASSTAPGPEGLDGPYEDVDVLMRPDAESMAWEGQQGVASFYPYAVGGRWYSHYGSHNYEPISHWRVGLASAPALSGPWKRLPEHSPLPFEKEFIENPIVSRIGPYHVAVYDSASVGENTEYLMDGMYIGYSFSRNGMDWAPGKRLAIHRSPEESWAADVRTPLGLIPLENGEFALLYTARDKTKMFWNVGLTTVKAAFREHAAVE